MKKFLIFSAATVLCFTILFLISSAKTQQDQTQAMGNIIRLHVRAADDSTEEQQLKEAVRDEILNYTTALLEHCDEALDAKELLTKHLTELEKVGTEVISREGKNHKVTVELRKEAFEYREYDGFFLPAGEYESLIVTIGEGRGKNWWCVVFPAACYMGCSDKIETEPQAMPSCFRLATERQKDTEVRWGIWEWIKGLFS